MLFFILALYLVPLALSAIPATLQETSGKAGSYGTYLLSFTSGGSEYLLVAEGGATATHNDADVYAVTSVSVAKVQTHKLASAYNGFAHDGTALFVRGGYISGSSYVYDIKAYSLSDLITTPVTAPVSSGNKAFTLSVTANPLYKKISTSYTSSNSYGYVAINGYGGKVNWCRFIGAGLTTAACTGTNELSSGSSSDFGYYQIAFAPGTSILAVGDSSTGTSGSAGSIYLFDLSKGNAQAMTDRVVVNSPTNTQYDDFGELFALSSSTLYAFSYKSVVYSFKLDGSATSSVSNTIYPISMALSVDGLTVILASTSYLQLLSASSSDGALSAKSKLSASDATFGYSALAASADLVFSSDYAFNSNDGIVYVTKEDTTPVPTMSPTSSAAAPFWPLFRHSSADCTGPSTMVIVKRASGLELLVAAAVAGKCSPDKDGAASTKYGGLSASEPDTRVYGLSYTRHATQVDCQNTTPDGAYMRVIFANGACNGVLGSHSCSSSTATSTYYSDDKCKDATSTKTTYFKTSSCVSSSGGDYEAISCTVEPKPKEDNAALAIGLGVGLGGGALLLGGGAFYYFKVLAPHHASTAGSPSKVVPVDGSATMARAEVVHPL